MTSKKRPNPNAVKQWFITYPRHGGTHTRESFSQSFPPARYIYCCEEEHDDEDGLHFHLIIDFKHPIKFKELKHYVEVKFPDSHKRIQYRPVRSLEHSQDYTAKVDPSPYVEGTLEKPKKPKKMPKYLLEQWAYKQNYLDIMQKIQEDQEEAEAYAVACSIWEKHAEDTQSRYGDKFDKELFLSNNPEPEIKDFYRAKQKKLEDIKERDRVPFDPMCPF